MSIQCKINATNNQPLQSMLQHIRWKCCCAVGKVSQIFWVRISDEFGPWPGFQQNLQYQFCSYNHIQVNYSFSLSYMYFFDLQFFTSTVSLVFMQHSYISVEFGKASIPSVEAEIRWQPLLSRSDTDKQLVLTPMGCRHTNHLVF